jgi:hypothetical protein
MEDHTEQHLDKLAKKVMRSSLLESPSMEFTSNVMTKVKAAAASDITAYKPLISRRTWIILLVLFVGCVIYSFLETDLQSLGWMDQLDFSIISKNKVTEALSGIAFSKTLAYAIGFFGLLFFVQIPIMKHYYNRQFE